MQYLMASKQTFDIIFCDPPSFSVTKDRRVQPFQVQDNGKELIQLCLDRLTPSGELIFLVPIINRLKWMRLWMGWVCK